LFRRAGCGGGDGGIGSLDRQHVYHQVAAVARLDPTKAGRRPGASCMIEVTAAGGNC